MLDNKTLNPYNSYTTIIRRHMKELLELILFVGLTVILIDLVIELFELIKSKGDN
jgi:hypothetical protein